MKYKIDKEYKEDCFAFNDKSVTKEHFCRALNNVMIADCRDCKFYRTDITSDKIERDIVKYKNIKQI